MAGMPRITGIMVGIAPAGLSSGFDVPGAGHEKVTLSFSDGSNMTLEAGPSGALGTGDLVEQNYGGTASAQILLSTPSVNTTGYNILDAYDNYAATTADTPVSYSADGSDGYNSNAWVNALLLSAGVPPSVVNDINQQLQQQSGLSPIGAGDGSELAPEFTGDDGGGDDDGGGGRLEM